MMKMPKDCIYALAFLFALISIYSIVAEIQ